MAAIKIDASKVRETLVNDFTTYITRFVERAVVKYGPALRTIGNSSDARFYYQTVLHVLDHGRGINDPVSLNANKLARAASTYADAMIADWERKINAKLDGCTNVELIYGRGGDFAVNAIRGDDLVRMEQQTVFKVNSHGTPFHQFPARIYVNGTFTPEKKFKAA